MFQSVFLCVCITQSWYCVKIRSHKIGYFPITMYFKPRGRGEKKGKKKKNLKNTKENDRSYFSIS